MYNIKARVFDGEVLTCLRLTDKDVETLLKVSCHQVLASMEAVDYTDFPEILGCLIDQQFLFLVEVNHNIPSNERGCYKATHVCQHAEIIRMFFRRELFSPHNTAMPTIGRLLGQQGRGSYMNQPYGTSTMRATMADDFANMTSNVGRPSSSNSESFGYADMDSNGECQNDEPIDKHCVHWTEGET